jgi:hypothetical protein
LANKPYTKGVKKHRKWLKHLWGEGKRIVYTQSPYEGRVDTKGKPLLNAYIVLFGKTKYVRLVPGRMAEGIWRRRDMK